MGLAWPDQALPIRAFINADNTRLVVPMRVFNHEMEKRTFDFGGTDLAVHLFLIQARADGLYDALQNSSDLSGRQISNFPSSQRPVFHIHLREVDRSEPLFA